MAEAERFEEFFKQFYEKEMMSAAAHGRKSIEIDFSLLEKFDHMLADKLLNDPGVIIDAARMAIKAVDLPEGSVSLEPRFKNLPEESTVRIRNLRAEHMGRFLSIEGVVRRASEVRPQIYLAKFQCPACENMIDVEQKDRTIKTPSVCECGQKSGFTMVDQRLFDMRWLTIEEPFEVATAERPGMINVYLKNDLTTPEMQRKTDPGNRLKISGTIKEIKRITRGKAKTQLEIYLDANHIESTEIEWEEVRITPEDERKIRQMASDPEIYKKIVASVAPSMYGMEEVKEAIAYQLFGGVPQYLPDGTRIRGDVHVLLVGDPSIGKTQILKLVSKSMPRGKYVSGKGVTGVGLCTIPDSLITLKNGELIKIGNLVEDNLRRGKREIKDGIFIAKKPEEMEILAFDQKELKIKPLKITQYWKIRAPKKLMKIKTRTGKEVTVTPNNPVPVIKNGKVKWKEAKSLKEGEFIATPRSVANQPEYSNTSILNFLDKTAHLLNAQDIIKHILERVRERGTIRDFARKLQIDENQLCHSWRLGKGSPQLDILETMCNHVNLELEEVLPEKMQLMQYNGHVINLSKSFTTKLLYLIGLVAGDGNVSRTPHGGFCIEFHSAEKELLEKFYTVCQNELNIEPHYYKHPDRIAYCSINSKIVAQLMHKLGVPNGKKSQHIEITQELSNLPNELVAAYLHGLFDTDGCVVEPKNKGSKFVSFSTSSKAFAKGLQLLLLRFGILSSMRKKAGKTTYIKNRPVISKDKYEIELRGLENLLRFKEEIGFGFSKKKEKLEKIIRKISKTNTNIDIVPEISNLLASARKELGISAKTLYGYKNYSYEMGRRKPSRQQLAKIVGKMKSFGNSKTIERLEKLAKSDIFWDEIKDVEIVKNKQFDYVYDVTVEDEHSLIADGIIIHNTATVTKDEEFMGGWVLEAGAMVLCHKGIIAIDEFDKMHKDDQIAMHEAMSTQSYHGDTKITLSDGSIKSIRNIVENMLEKNKGSVINGQGCEVLLLPENECIELMATNFNKIFSKRITRVSRHTAPKYFFEIETDSGRKIIVTPEHPCWVMVDGKIVCLPASKLKRSNWVPVPLNLPIEGQKQNISIVQKDIAVNRASNHISIPRNCPQLFKFAGYMLSEGSYELNKGIKNGINFTNSNPLLLNDFVTTTTGLFGIEPYIHIREGKTTMARYISRELYNFVNKIGLSGMAFEKKIPDIFLMGAKDDVKLLLQKLFDGNGGLISKQRGMEIVYTSKSKTLALQISDLLLRFGIPSKIRETQYKNKIYFRVAITGKKYLKSFQEHIGFSDEKTNRKLAVYVKGETSLRTNLWGTIPQIGAQIADILRKLKLPQKRIVGWNITEYERYKLNFSRTVLGKVIKRVERYLAEIERQIEIIENLPSEKRTIKKLRRIRTAYRISTQQVAEKLGLCHQLISFREIKSPTRKFAIRYKQALVDIFKDMLQQRFEIGRIKNLVNADVGWVKIKNIKKVENKNEKFVYDVTIPGQTFISNGMVLHNTISVAKATIVATLPSQTAVLAGANPKYSRFDPYRPIVEQIDIPDTLLSRFDLKFVLRDVPDKAMDEKLATYVVGARLRPDDVRPLIAPEMLRKYIAYARHNCFPKMTPEAAERIKNFYITMRGMYAGEERPTVPITLRQYEALMRLAEASAKIRLSNKVEVEDVDRVIRIMEYSIKQLGFDRETEKIDIDRTEGVPSSQRRKIHSIIDIIERLEKTIGKPVPIEEIKATAQDEGIKESDTEDMLQRLKKEGIIFEPKANFVQKL